MSPGIHQIFSCPSRIVSIFFLLLMIELRRTNVINFYAFRISRNILQFFVFSLKIATSAIANATSVKIILACVENNFFKKY